MKSMIYRMDLLYVRLAIGFWPKGSDAGKFLGLSPKFELESLVPDPKSQTPSLYPY